uniref:Uncharacterized protein n=1 Tax=Cacopsylla melanoneura TaxID=428564 RepID=A0A8D8VE89_9HEMI
MPYRGETTDKAKFSTYLVDNTVAQAAQANKLRPDEGRPKKVKNSKGMKLGCIYCTHQATSPKLLVLHVKRVHKKVVKILKVDGLNLPRKMNEKKVDQSLN